MAKARDGRASYWKNDYKSVIDITYTLICHIVSHMIAILVCNKVNSGWSKYIQRCWIFWSYVDTLKEGVGQHRKREFLKDAISKCKAYLLGGKQKWTHKKVDKAGVEST